MKLHKWYYQKRNSIAHYRAIHEPVKLDEYSCAMKSHFRKFGNQMSGSGNHLCNYASLLAECFIQTIYLTH